MRSYINGKQYGYKGGMKLVAKGSQHIDSLMFDNFFGGSAKMAAKRNEVRAPATAPRTPRPRSLHPFFACLWSSGSELHGAARDIGR